LYAGHDGNVYKRSDSGSWQKYDNGGWNNARAASAGENARTFGQLQSDRTAREQGAERTNTFGSMRGSAEGASSYRPSGGGGGGRRRR
jgi:hypothetical protein